MSDHVRTFDIELHVKGLPRLAVQKALRIELGIGSAGQPGHERPVRLWRKRLCLRRCSAW